MAAAIGKPQSSEGKDASLHWVPDRKTLRKMRHSFCDANHLRYYNPRRVAAAIGPEWELKVATRSVEQQAGVVCMWVCLPEGMLARNGPAMGDELTLSLPIKSGSDAPAEEGTTWRWLVKESTFGTGDAANGGGSSRSSRGTGEILCEYQQPAAVKKEKELEKKKETTTTKE